MFKILEKYPIATIFIVLVLILLPNINFIPVSIMEARIFISAREMISEGNWWLTSMNGLPRYEKPPLPTWITAFTGLLFGFKSLFFLRLPVVLMLALVGVYVYRFTYTYLEKSLGLINSLIVVTSFYVLAISIEAPWDVYAHGFMLAAIYHLFKMGVRDKILAVLFIACSVLSKGPVSIYALLLSFILAYIIVYKPSIKTNFKLFFLTIFGVFIGSIWFLSVRLLDPSEFLRIASKETANWTSYHVKPFYYYWNFFLQSGMWSVPALVALVYPYMKNRVNDLKAYQLSLLWVLISVILLSIIPEKKARYLMPVLIPLAMNTGFYIKYIRDHYLNKSGIGWRWPILIHYGLFAVLSLLLPFVISFQVDFTSFTFELFIYLIYVPLGIAFILLLIRKSFEQIFYLSIVFFILAVGTSVSLLIQSPVENKAYCSINELKKEMDKEGLEIYYWDKISPEMIWEYGSIIPKTLPLNGSCILLKDSVIGVLVNDESQFDSLRLKDKFAIEKRLTYDLNRVSINSRRYKNRLVNHFYQLKRK